MMRRFVPAMALATLLWTPSFGCHDTAQGIKQDTKRALQKTGQKLEKAGDKIDGHGDKKKDGQ
jgi:hypothetical protein